VDGVNCVQLGGHENYCCNFDEDVFSDEATDKKILPVQKDFTTWVSCPAASSRLSTVKFNSHEELQSRRSGFDSETTILRSQDFFKGGAEIMEAKAMKSKNCLW